MPRICYVDRRFNSSSLKLIETANAIIAEYTAQGFKLTLRQLYYQFVARDIIANNMQSYKRLGSVINDARLAGLIDWDSIEDRTRNLKSLAHWDSGREILEAVSQQFRYDRWKDQPCRIEVWVEKDALTGVIEPTCNEYRVPYFACRGYSSQSETWGAGRRFLEYLQNDQRVIVLHIGDHDPSGLDMTRDNDDRLAMFSGNGDVTVKRLALNYDQVRRYKPPPNPAKLTDSRADKYIAEFGKSSWELDALDPKVIAALIKDNIESEIDFELWDQAVAAEEATRLKLLRTAKHFKDAE